jgi:hypothetical protein
VAIGTYLPFSQSVAIFIGGVVASLVKRALVRRQANQEILDASEQKSVLFASGLITGEALMGIIVAIPVVLMKNKGLELPLTSLWKQLAESWLPSVREGIDAYGAWLGLIVLLLIALWSYRTSRQGLAGGQSKIAAK